MERKERIELHTHSKSGGRSTMYAGDIIRNASVLNLPAVAITDENSILAYPELANVHENGKYSARPIFGAELSVSNDFTGAVCNVSVLVKNDTGRKTLYKLFSAKNCNPEMLSFDFKELLSKREGLLIGSGTLNGAIYPMVEGDISNEKIVEVMSLFDYIEILPAGHLIDSNIKIIELCEELMIPVVVVSDARFCDNIGRMAWQAFRTWEDNADYTEYRLISTEEMLAHFTYLLPKKAYEIVVENTHKIADMCEPIEVIPKEQCMCSIPGSLGQVREICEQELSKKYSGERIKAAEERLDYELSAIEGTGSDTYFLQVRELFLKMNLKACDISLRGTAATSLILYLMGINGVDPIKYNLSPEIILEFGKHRNLELNINMSSENRKRAEDLIKEVEGVGATVRAGSVRLISEYRIDQMIRLYDKKRELDLDDDMKERIKIKISGNVTGRARDVGGIFIFPKGYDYAAATPLALDGDKCVTTYFDRHDVDSVYIRLNAFNHKSHDLLSELSKRTGVSLSDVPVGSSDVFNLLRPDGSGKYENYHGIPELGSMTVPHNVPILWALKPKTIEDFAKVISLTHGTDVWSEEELKLVLAGTITVKNIIATRDDVFDYILSLGFERKKAFEIANAVRKGLICRGGNQAWQKWKNELIEAGAEDWFIASCEKIKYLFPRAHALSYIFTSFRAAWFKVHYPGTYNEVLEYTFK